MEKIIFGIGNPGIRYKNNRHNAGFLFLDYFASTERINFLPSPGDYYEAKGKMESKTFSLVIPTIYVNNSGIAAKQIIERYNVDIQDFLVISDDVNLVLGTTRVRLSGGDGGHNGLASIIYQLNSEKFPRIRIGIGSGEQNEELSNFVLSDFKENEFDILNKAFDEIMLLVKEFIIGGSKNMLEANSRR